MAFHPLRYFQKHQKVFLAGITIVAMVTFVLTGSLTGRGDFFDYIVRLVGGEGRYPRVATVYGKGVNTQELEQLRQRRYLANQYVQGAILKAADNVRRKAEQASAKWEPFQRQSLLEGAQTAYQLVLFGNQFPQAQKLEFARRALMTLSFLREDLDTKKKTAEAQLVGQVLLLLHHSLADRPSGRFYFGGSDSTDSLLDFLIWRHQADQLGITLTERDVKVLAKRESLGLLDGEQSGDLVREILSRQRNVSVEMLLSALNDEFRVRMAQSALTGYDPGSRAQVPAPITPEEFWDFFREYRTEVSTALVPIAVEEFVGQVKDQKPTDAQMEELFEKYKEQEPNPDSPAPGFKQPRRVGVEWVSARPDSPHYKKAAETAAAVLQVISPGTFQALLIDQYSMTKYSHPMPPLTEPSFLLALYTDPNKPESAASTFGMILGALNSHTSPLPIVASYKAAAILRTDKEKAAAAQQEIKRRAPALATLAASGLTGSPLQFLTTWQAAGHQDQYMPLEALRPELVKKVQEGLARQFVDSSLTAVKKELDSRKSRPEEARKYLAEAIKKYALEHGTTQKPRAQYDVGDDPGLAALKEAYLKAQRTQDPRARAFARLFFDSARMYDAQRWSGGMLGTGEEQFLYWKTSDKAAYVPKFAEVKDQVEAAWKFERARVLAKQEADDLAAKARAGGKGAVAVLTQGSPHSGTLFTLDSVARLRIRPMTRAGMSRVYEPYSPPEDKLEYPRPDLVDRLLTLKDPKQAIVFDDRPEKIYYVAAMLPDTYRPATIEQFASIYRGAAPGALMSDQLFGILESTQQERYRQVCLEQLRAEAKLTIVQDSRRKQDEGSPLEDY
jgi:hypothetical protein